MAKFLKLIKNSKGATANTSNYAGFRVPFQSCSARRLYLRGGAGVAGWVGEGLR